MATVPTSHNFAEKDGSFQRKPSTFRSSISPDPDSQFPAEKDRYVLYIHIGCPWAHRTNIVRSLKGLEDVVQLVVWDISMIHEGKGWGMSGDRKEPVYGLSNIRELYEKTEPGYVGRYTVPVLWDKKTETIVNNESSEIIRMFYSCFDNLLPPHMRESTKGTAGLFPPHLRADIESMNDWVYPDLNNGVYKSGFATAQSAYDAAVTTVFRALDRLEAHFAQTNTPYLFGDNITEADIRLYPTIVRFDVAYHTIFKCNMKMIRHDYPRLHAWVRRLYWDESEGTRGAFGRTVNFDTYREGYASAVRMGVVPVGPEKGILPLDE